MTEKTLDVCQCHEKHAPTYWKGVVREYKEALDKAESRPLTPDAITDEMVERARNAPSFDGRLSPTPRLVREMLTAALTEPPARPEGARDIEVLLFDVGVDENRAEVANYLAARLNDPTRKEA